VRFEGEPATHLVYEDLEALGVRHAFTTRHHGSFPWVSAAGGPFGGDGSAGPALRVLGVAGSDVRYARQVHGTTTLLADGASTSLVGTGDALAAGARGIPLAIFTADCLAVILADPGRSALAVAHAGWRGTVAGLAGRLVDVLVTRLQARPAELEAAIGPSIGPCCYEVDEPVVGPLGQAFPADWTRWARPAGPGKWRLDLWQANADQLVAAGLRPDAIRNARLCTSCRRDLFFSYRREGGGRRLAALAVLP
jgi:YfiH family protein